MLIILVSNYFSTSNYLKFFILIISLIHKILNNYELFSNAFSNFSNVYERQKINASIIIIILTDKFDEIILFKLNISSKA